MRLLLKSAGWQYWLLAFLAVVVLVTIALFSIWEQGRQSAAKSREVIEARSLNAIDEIREAIREAGTSVSARHEWFVAFATGASAGPSGRITELGQTFSVRPVGAFIWEPQNGILWQFGLDGELKTLLASRVTWNAWAQPGKRPTRRALDAILVDGGVRYLLWGRVANELYGLVFDVPPITGKTETGFYSTMAGSVIGAAMALLIGMVLMGHSVVKSKRDNALKTRFVSDVSHELKTPLAAMGLWLDMLLGGRLREERKTHALQVVVEEKNRLLRLVNALLDFTRLEAGRRQYALTTLDLGQAAREAVQLLAGDFPSGGVRVDAAEGLYVRADKDAVREIFLNLLSNAAKYAAAGGPVDVVVARRGGCVTATVSDRGPGLSPEVVTKVFDRFYRAEDATAQAKGGFGLGLPIARGLARGMNGELSVAAREGGGCTFLLELPPVL